MSGNRFKSKTAHLKQYSDRYRAKKQMTNPENTEQMETDDSAPQTSSQQPQNRLTKHPPHLKGREIGLFYARQNSQRNQDDQILKGPNITLTADKIKEIRGSLNIDATNKFNSSLREEFLKQIGDTFEAKIRSQIFIQTGKPRDELDSLHSDALLEKFAILQTDEDYIQMQEFRQSLPTFTQKQTIIETIRQNQVILIMGATGSGKTTQICQYILDDALINNTGGSCRIICTQPRRIAATSIAERVAAERAQKLGDSIGYHIRLDKIMPREMGGSILFCTTGVILKMLESDPSLSQYSHIFLDEVHERQIHTDIALGVLKLVLKHRGDLKVILMSATLTAAHFSAYFDNCPVVEIPGVTFPVEEFFLEDVLKETQYFNFQSSHYSRKSDRDEQHQFDQLIRPYVNSIKDKYSSNVIKTLLKIESESGEIELVEELIHHISVTKPMGAILVFLPGYEQISKLLNKLQKSNHFPQDKFKIYPLHSLLTGSDQRSIFLRPPEGVRKIILSTQMAETSITIDDVVYVINGGKHKKTVFNNQKNLNELQVSWLTKANASQRKGRAGRVQPGVCYHLYTRGRANLLDDFEKPEILRIRLEEVILSIKVLCMNDIKVFFNSLIDPPPEDVIIRSINMLKRMEALSDDEELTPLGLHLAQLPVHPQIGKMILLSSIFSCVNPIATVAASLSFKSPFYHVMGQEKRINQIKYNFSRGTNSDHLAVVNAVEEWHRQKSNNDFCYDHFLSFTTLTQIQKMKNQFGQMLFNSSFLSEASLMSRESNYNSENEKILKAIIAAALYPNIAYRKVKMNSRGPSVAWIKTVEGRVKLFGSSVNAEVSSDVSSYLVYHEKQKINSSVFLFDSTAIQPYSIVLFGDNLKTGQLGDTKFISVGGIAQFRCDDETAKLIFDLRSALNLVLENKISQPAPATDWNSDEGVLLSAIIKLISTDGKEDFACQSDEDYD